MRRLETIPFVSVSYRLALWIKSGAGYTRAAL